MKLPGVMADKEYKFSNYIGNDILKQYGLVNEMSEQMMTAIEKKGIQASIKRTDEHANL